MNDVTTPFAFITLSFGKQVLLKQYNLRIIDHLDKLSTSLTMNYVIIFDNVIIQIQKRFSLYVFGNCYQLYFRIPNYLRLFSDRNWL